MFFLNCFSCLVRVCLYSLSMNFGLLTPMQSNVPPLPYSFGCQQKRAPIAGVKEIPLPAKSPVCVFWLSEGSEVHTCELRRKEHGLTSNLLSGDLSHRRRKPTGCVRTGFFRSGIQTRFW